MKKPVLILWYRKLYQIPLRKSFKSYRGAIFLILLMLFSCIAYAARPLIPREIGFEGEIYYYDRDWKRYQRRIKGDLDNDGQNEIVISFAASRKPKGWKKGQPLLTAPFHQIYERVGKKYKLVKTIKGSQYLGEISIEDFSKDGKKQLVIWSKRGKNYIDIYIYQWLDEEYKLIFKDGSNCAVELKKDKATPEIWLGRSQCDKAGWRYESGDFLYEVFTWDGEGFIYNPELSTK